MGIRTIAIAVTLALAACSENGPSSESGEMHIEVKFGEAATQEGAPFGFDLPDDATVLASLLPGTGIQVRTASSLKDLKEFYRSELARLGFREISEETLPEKIKLVGINPSEPSTRMQISVAQSDETDGSFTLVFLKLVD